MATDNEQTTLEPPDRIWLTPQFAEAANVIGGGIYHVNLPPEDREGCIEYTRVSAASTAPVVDELGLLLRRIGELKMDEGFSSHYQRGFEQFRDQMTAVLKARLAAASPAAPAVHDLSEVFRDVSIKAHIGFKHEKPWEQCEWIECEDRRKMIELLSNAISGLSDLFVLLSKDSRGRWCFNSFSRDADKFHLAIERLSAALPALANYDNCPKCGAPALEPDGVNYTVLHAQSATGTLELRSNNQRSTRHAIRGTQLKTTTKEQI